jgi:hypothetical protein
MLLYGVHPPKILSEKKIYRASKRLSIPKNDVYKLDVSYYNFLLSLDTIKCDSTSSQKQQQRKKDFKYQLKNHYQPLQARYYNDKGQLVSLQINCYAGGFPNFEWNRDSIMYRFPPKIQAPLDSLVSIPSLLKHIQPLSESSEIKLASYDYVVFVFWGKFMGRQNKRFIKYIHENRKLAAGKNVKYIYINTDAFLLLSGIW